MSGASAAKPTPADQIIAACERDWDTWRSDCSGFVKAVAADLGVFLSGQANDIVDAIAARWKPAKDGVEAAARAADGKFVIGGLKDQPNGHVVVVVKGPLNRGKYPTAYWGQLGGIGEKETTINYSWGADDRDKVAYYSCDIDRSLQTAPGAVRVINWSFADFEKKVAGWLSL
nr:hypothetical protein [uncultured Rhodopila sp.]